MRYDRLSEQIKTHSVIFFDVFDTILNRLTPKPEDVFDLVEERFNLIKNTLTNFSKNRISAEKICRKKSQNEEITYDDIYKELEKVYGQQDAIWLKQTELDTEARVTVVNNTIYEIYQQCLQDGKKVYFVSDMYLPGKAIQKLLTIHQIREFDGVYSSSDFGKTKSRNGALFDAIIEKEKIAKKDILHIGNDSNADYIKPKARGMDAFLIQSTRDSLHGRYYQRSLQSAKKNFQYRILDGFTGWYLNNHQNESLQFKLGFEIFGPLLFGYTKWLSNQCDNLRINRVFFLSRDGYILEKAFNALRKDVKTSYLYVSRKSVIVPAIYFDKTFDAIIKHYKSWPREFSAEYLFKRFSVPQKITSDAIRSWGLDSKKLYQYNDLFNDDKFRLAIKEILPFLRHNAQEQLKFFLKYLDKEQFNDRIGVVDIGGNCSIEFALNELINKAQINVTPFYLYVNRSIEAAVNRKAYIDLTSNTLQALSIRRFCYMFLELLLAAPHGTVLGYYKKNAEIKPVLAEDEFDHTVGGVNEKFFIENLQRGALEFVRQFSSHFGGNIQIPQSIILSNLINFGITPLQEDIDCWSDFCTYEDSYNKLIYDRTHYWQHPSFFLQDMKKSVWAGGFLMKHLDNGTLIRFLLKLYKLYKDCQFH